MGVRLMARAPRKAPTVGDNSRKVPKLLGDCADALYTTRAERLSIKKDVAALEDYEKEIKNYIIDNLPKSNASGITGKVATATIQPKDIPIVEDWDIFGKYLKKTGFYHLLQRRLSVEAVNEILDSGKKIPGVAMFRVLEVNVRKK